MLLFYIDWKPLSVLLVFFVVDLHVSIKVSSIYLIWKNITSLFIVPVPLSKQILFSWINLMQVLHIDVVENSCHLALKFSLTHRGRDKMAAISQTMFLDAFLWMKPFVYWLNFTFVPKGPIDNVPALVNIMAWRQPGNKPLSQPMVVRLLMQPQWVKWRLQGYRRFS